MKAITLWQPWASAIALGLKTVETRPPWAMRLANLVGEDVVIHAAATDRPLAQLHKAAALGDPEAQHLLDAIAMGDPDMSPLDDLPRGAALAVARIAAVVKVYEPASATGIIPPDRAMIDPGPQHGLRWTEPTGHSAHGWRIHHVEDQRPWGDFTPGRVAIALDDVRALAEPVPCRGHQQLWTLPIDVERDVLQQTSTAGDTP